MAVRAGVQLCVSVTSSMSHFFFRENRARRLLRGGKGGGSALCVRCELDVTKKIFPRIELGGSSVAVRAGVQLGVSVASSLSAKEYSRESSSEAPPWR